jgi:hypothetical protein
MSCLPKMSLRLYYNFIIIISCCYYISQQNWIYECLSLSLLFFLLTSKSKVTSALLWSIYKRTTYFSTGWISIFLSKTESNLYAFEVQNNMTKSHKPSFGWFFTLTFDLIHCRYDILYSKPYPLIILQQIVNWA